MKPSPSSRSEGFPGQRIIVLPRRVVDRALSHPLLESMLPTDIGMFPSARGHVRERERGSGQAIFIHCLRGAGWCRLAGREHAVGAGDLLVLPPGIAHAYGADTRHPWTIQWFHATGRGVAAWCAETGAAPERPVVRPAADPALAAFFDEALGALERGYTLAHLLQAASALGHLLALMAVAARGGSSDTPDARQRIARSIAHMKSHLDHPLTNDRLATLAGFAPSHYAAVFRRETGYAPWEYFTRLRMHQACQLLDTTHLAIKDVAGRVGFDDPLYFSRAFRRVHDMSPSEYRERPKG